MKNNKGIIHLLPLLLVGILIVAGGYGMYWYGKNSGQEIISKSTLNPEDNTGIKIIKQENYPNVTFSETPFFINEFEEDRNANWQKFKTNNFTVMYPNDRRAYNAANNSTSLNSFSLCPKDHCQDAEMTIYPYKNTTLELEFSKIMSEVNKYNSTRGLGDKKQIEVQEFILKNQYKGIIVRGIPNYGNTNNEKARVFFKAGEILIGVSFNSDNYINSQVLASFEFVE